MLKTYGRTYSTFFFMLLLAIAVNVVTLILSFNIPVEQLPKLVEMIGYAKWSLTVLLGSGLIIGARSAAEDFSPPAPPAPPAGGQT
jgi:hypothetical protein